MLGDRARTHSDRGYPGLSSTARRDLLVLGLTWSAGFVDAISFLGLGSVFTANMTGNTMLLGIALGRGDLPGALRSLIALAGFCLGATAGALIVMRSDRPLLWPPSITNALVLEFATLIALALGWRWAGARAVASPGLIQPLIMVSAFAMGVQSAAVRRIGVSAVTSTAVTGTLAGVMAGAVGWLHGAVAVARPEHARAPGSSWIWLVRVGMGYLRPWRAGGRGGAGPLAKRLRVARRGGGRIGRRNGRNPMAAHEPRAPRRLGGSELTR